MDKIGAFQIIHSDDLEFPKSNPYMVAHFYYGIGHYSEWKYDPIKRVYEHRNDTTRTMSAPNHICKTIDEMYYIMRTCIESCCCPNDQKRTNANVKIKNYYYIYI